MEVLASVQKFIKIQGWPLPIERSAYFYVTISERFKGFHYFNFERNFLENENFVQKTGVPFFS